MRRKDENYEPSYKGRERQQRWRSSHRDQIASYMRVYMRHYRIARRLGLTMSEYWEQLGDSDMPS